jgi:thymidylate synthase ThyX
MAITAKILADSLAPCGKRLTTMEWTYPRSIHSEIMTHRMLSKNSASSRAIPTEKLIQRVVDDPFIPEYIGANQKGMQAGEELNDVQKEVARMFWLQGRDQAVENARRLLDLGVHKQVVNRIIEPWMWITIIVSATEWDNVWGLRCHPMAEPHFQKLAYTARDAMAASVPRELKMGDWHLPLVPIDEEDGLSIGRFVAQTALMPVEFHMEIGLQVLLEGGIPDNRAAVAALGDKILTDDQKARLVAKMTEVMIKVSVGRCARVSYLTHEGKREIEKDVELHDRLVVQEPLHASPAEHVAQALVSPERSGNFVGWRQYRKTLPNENIGGPLP